MSVRKIEIFAIGALSEAESVVSVSSSSSFSSLGVS